mmetsp:Transcript_70339/g.195802  ORF Transcript_70339/g.195802 Transcript_70339/m.195802 type:complete len:219 (-) Transcript_70339:984-1640(-)
MPSWRRRPRRTRCPRPLLLWRLERRGAAPWALRSQRQAVMAPVQARPARVLSGWPPACSRLRPQHAHKEGGLPRARRRPRARCAVQAWRCARSAGSSLRAWALRAALARRWTRWRSHCTRRGRESPTPKSTPNTASGATSGGARSSPRQTSRSSSPGSPSVSWGRTPSSHMWPCSAPSTTQGSQRNSTRTMPGAPVSSVRVVRRSLTSPMPWTPSSPR